MNIHIFSYMYRRYQSMLKNIQYLKNEGCSSKHKKLTVSSCDCVVVCHLSSCVHVCFLQQHLFLNRLPKCYETRLGKRKENAYEV